MRATSQRRLSEIKQSLRSYINEMFTSMLQSFTLTLQTQFARLEQAYNKCLRERSLLSAEQEGLQKMKRSLAKIFGYVDQLEKEICVPSISTNIKSQYYQFQGEDTTRMPMTDRSSIRGLSNIPTSASSSTRRFERKTSNRGILKPKVSGEEQKENRGINLYEKLYQANSGQLYGKRS